MHSCYLAAPGEKQVVALLPSAGVQKKKKKKVSFGAVSLARLSALLHKLLMREKLMFSTNS